MRCRLLVRATLRSAVPTILVAGVASAQVPCDARQLLPADGPGGSVTLYGEAIAVDGDVLCVGALQLQLGPPAPRVGQAYVYERTAHAWSEVARLLSPDGNADDRFGERVAVAGDEVFVAGIGLDTPSGLSAGGVVVYERTSTGVHSTQRLHARDAAIGPGPQDVTGHEFGAGLAVEGDLLAVGAPQDAVGGEAVGAVYLYRRGPEGWDLEAKLRPPAAAGAGQMGRGVAVAGDFVFAGAPYTDAGGQLAAGAVHVFERAGGTWQHRQVLRPSGAQAAEYVGFQLVAEDDLLVVGSPNHDAAGESSVQTGRVVVFRNRGGTWVEEVQLQSDSVQPWDLMGVRVALEGGGVFASAPDESNDGIGSAGFVYEFRRVAGAWRQVRRMHAAVQPEAFRFGAGLAVEGDELFAGCTDAPLGYGDWAVWIVELDAADCNENAWPDSCEIWLGLVADVDLDGVPDECGVAVGSAFCLGDGSSGPCPCGNHVGPGTVAGCTHSGGLGATLAASGTPSLAADSLVLRGSGLPESVGLFFQANAEQLPAAFGDGLLCIGGSVRRIGTSFVSGGAATWPDSGTTPVSLRGAVTAPATRLYQLWYRNPAEHCTPATFNLSNALLVGWLP